MPQRALVVFGDQLALSDTEDRQSWVDALSHAAKVPVAHNFAADGALAEDFLWHPGTKQGEPASLAAQVHQFTQSLDQDSSDFVLVIAVGLEDALRPTAVDSDMDPHRVARAVRSAVARLQEAGGRHFLVCIPYSTVRCPLSYHSTIGEGILHRRSYYAVDLARSLHQLAASVEGVAVLDGYRLINEALECAGHSGHPPLASVDAAKKSGWNLEQASVERGAPEALFQNDTRLSRRGQALLGQQALQLVQQLVEDKS